MGVPMYQKLTKTLDRLHRNERGITGLETAIILIAFVTVAAVLAYSVLSAGLFSAERGTETVYQGAGTGTVHHGNQGLRDRLERKQLAYVQRRLPGFRRA